MKKGLRLKIYIGCLLLILFGVLCGFADQTEQRVIKVGYVPTEGYIEKTENGTYKGYMSEYLELLSYYGEWQCEYVPGTVEECRTWLAEGKIDILPGISRVETVEGIVLSDLPLDQVNDSIYVLDDGKIASYENLQDMRIGYVEGCPLNEDYFQKKRLNCEFEAFSHMSELLTALEEQKVNGAMGVFCSDASDLKLIAKLNPRAVYIGFHQGDEEVKAQVEDALEKVSMEMPELLEELKEKYSASSKNYEVVLSSVE